MPTLAPGSLPDIDRRLAQHRLLWHAARALDDHATAASELRILDALLGMRHRRLVEVGA